MRNEGGLLILLMLVLFFLKTWLRRSLSHPIGCRSWEKCAFSSSHAFLLLTSLRLENEKRASNSSSELPASSSSLLLLSKERSEKSWRDILALACCSSWSAGGMLSVKRGARREEPEARNSSACLRCLPSLRCLHRLLVQDLQSE